MTELKLNGQNKMPVNLKLLVVLCCAAYVVYAMFYNVLGSNATVMMEFFHITESQQGFITAIQSVGILVATIFLGLFGERFNKLYGITFGLLLLTLGCMVIGLSSPLGGGITYNTLLVLVLIAGAGFTFIDIMVNGTLTENFKNKSTLVPIVHGFHGIGAMIAPVLVTAVVNPEIVSTFSVPFLIIGIATAVVFLIYIFTGKKVTASTVYADMSVIKKRAVANPAEIFRTKEAWILIVAGITYFAFQVGIGAWLPTFCSQELGMSYQLSGQMVTLFWAGSLVMRFVSPIFLKKVRTKNLYVICMLVSCATMAAALFVNNTAAMMVLVTISGFMQGVQATMIILIGSSLFPTRTASMSSIIPLSIGIASLVFPYIMGLMAENTGFASAFVLIVISHVISGIVIFFLGRKREL